MATINMLEETANYLLNHCFVLGGVEDQRAKYLYVQDHLDEVRAVFAPLGYSVLLCCVVLIVPRSSVVRFWLSPVPCTPTRPSSLRCTF